MFQWKQFHIDPQYLLLDDTRLPRPFYVSPSVWIEWCEAIREGDTYQEGYDACHKEYENFIYTEKDVERKIDDEVSDIQREIERILDRNEIDDEVYSLIIDCFETR